MSRIVITLQLVLSLLASGWVQASVAGMLMHVDNGPADVVVVSQQDVPPCHQSNLLEPDVEQHHPSSAVSMACCDDGCQCDGLCQSSTYSVPSLQQSWQPDGSNQALDFSTPQLVAITSATLYRPPIR